ncbi:MAG: hypothetical protein JXB10_12175 [Pirellulales bacterium]|nr:hypothetical protein [Pirellulales bacterium]
MRIVILHNAVTERDSIADCDVLVQVDAVGGALRQLEHDVTTLPCTLDLKGMLAAVRRERPEVVFNLVESLAGEDSLIGLAPAVLETFRIPYAGCRAEALFLTTRKLLCKQRLRDAGLPTPDWMETVPWPRLRGHATEQVDNLPHVWNMPTTSVGMAPNDSQRKWIVKGVGDHASRDLDDGAVFVGDGAEVRRRLAEWFRRTGRPGFAEQFIDGREINQALLAGPEGVEILPPSEIDFSAFPPGKQRIVGYRAKWDKDAVEYHQTFPRFDFPKTDRPLLERIAALARQCWELFSLRGWARVDFRVDAAGQPWILEINANCCLSPEAGFAAALRQTQIPFTEAVRRIVEEAVT